MIICRIDRDHQKEQADLADVYLRKIADVRKQYEQTEFLDKDKARSQAQQDLAITQETHERLVQELRGDRRTQKEEIDRIKKQEDKMSNTIKIIIFIGRDHKEVLRDLELTQQRLETRTKKQALLEKKIRQYEEELKVQKESLTQVVKDFEREKELMKHHYEGEISKLEHEIKCILSV